jgi:hypothetical protein
MIKWKIGFDITGTIWKPIHYQKELRKLTVG